MKQYFLIITFLSIFIFDSCKNNDAPDVSSVKAEINLVRTESELSDAKNIDNLESIIDKNAPFYGLYLNEILGYKGMTKDSQIIFLDQWLKDSMVVALKKKTDSVFTDFSEVKINTEQMFRYMKYYLPEEKIHVPNLYTFISEFGYQIFIFEDKDQKDAIAVGLDMFLHPSIRYKNLDPENTNFSDYITRSWNKDHIPKKICEIYVNDLLGEPQGHRLIDQMVHNGKQLYIIKKMMPETPDTVIAEYTEKQLEWCRENELQMGSFFMDKKLFFETNLSMINKYLNPSPNSPDMPAEAPGRTANYIGWQIIRAYMERYPSTSIKQLIDLKDAQSILEKSKYKPKR